MELDHVILAINDRAATIPFPLRPDSRERVRAHARGHRGLCPRALGALRGSSFCLVNATETITPVSRWGTVVACAELPRAGGQGRALRCETLR